MRGADARGDRWGPAAVQVLVERWTAGYGMDEELAVPVRAGLVGILAALADAGFAAAELTPALVRDAIVVEGFGLAGPDAGPLTPLPTLAELGVMPELAVAVVEVMVAMVGLLDDIGTSAG
ncbi:hypothetical protein [Actinokineospora enzanensis]|uniref:hypothetical protein n=1 Tax=Actinokineospora enzanensis TaxID=155975 RepID=UPI0012EC7BF8|nr:hypothetical protein [Actinokineospora enzanensis]